MPFRFQGKLIVDVKDEEEFLKRLLMLQKKSVSNKEIPFIPDSSENEDKGDLADTPEEFTLDMLP